MVDYSFYVGLIQQALEDNTTLMSLVDGMVYTSYPGMIPADDQLQGTNGACIGIQHGGLISQSLPGIYYHGSSRNDHLIFFVITVLNKAGRNSDTYAGAITNSIHDILKSGIDQTMNGVSYQILFNQPFQITSVFDPNFPDRCNVKMQMEINYFG